MPKLQFCPYRLLLSNSSESIPKLRTENVTDSQIFLQNIEAHIFRIFLDIFISGEYSAEFYTEF